MTTIYVNKRNGLTAHKEKFELAGLRVYRTRATCGCAQGQNRRNAIIVISADDYLLAIVLQCKACVKLQEGGTP